MSLITRLPHVKKSGKGCWTCKARKIGCDQRLPYCNNCSRTGRSCEGYGIKLHWPESADGRRPLCIWEDKEQNVTNFRVSPSDGIWHFLNTTYDDMQSRTFCALNQGRTFRFQASSPTIPKSLTSGFENSLMPNDKMLISYYHEVLSRMITTIDDSKNGFRTILIPNALSNHSISSQSLRQAILALSAFHLWGRDAAVQYKIRAIRLLSQSIQRNEREQVAQFATCMMLCVCDVFDAADGSWYKHLCAANTICNQAKRTPTGGQITYFLTSWLAYHKVLAEFSHGPPRGHDLPIVPQLPSQAAEQKIIIGSLGCSMQVLEHISCINQLTSIISRSPSKTLPPEFSPIPNFLYDSLQTLTQLPGIVEDSASGRVDEARILTTAELYRIAALIYLHRSILYTPPNSPSIQELVERSLKILSELRVCTSPWPVFVTACEVVADEQRIMVLNALEKMQNERRIGNVEIMRGIIEAVWKASDLQSGMDGGGVRVDWKKLVNMKKGIPSFI